MNSTMFLLPFLGTLSAFGPLVLDLYLPALPIIEHDFSASSASAGFTLSATMMGLAFGQLVAGPISDKFGRKSILLLSLTLYTISTIIIFFTPNINLFIAMRAIEGFASAGSIVIARAVVADLYEGESMRKFFSLLIVINSLAPILSPVAGSFILSFSDWRGIFVALSLIGIVLFIASFNFKESLAINKRLKSSLIASYAVYIKLFFIKGFLPFVLVGAGALGVIFSYISSSAFILQEHYGFTPTKFALAFASNGAGFAIAAFLSSKISPKKAILFGCFLLTLFSILTAITLYFKFGVLPLLFEFFILLFSVGFIMPTTSFYAMSLAREYAGSASAMLGFAGFGMGGLVSFIIGKSDVFLGACATILFCGALSFVCLLLCRKFIK